MVISHEGGDFIGEGAVADEIPQAVDNVGALGLDVGPNRLQGVQVGVDVGENGEACHSRRKRQNREDTPLALRSPQRGEGKR